MTKSWMQGCAKKRKRRITTRNPKCGGQREKQNRPKQRRGKSTKNVLFLDSPVSHSQSQLKQTRNLLLPYSVFSSFSSCFLVVNLLILLFFSIVSNLRSQMAVSAIDSKKLEDPNALLYVANLAEQSERYPEMAQYMFVFFFLSNSCFHLPLPWWKKEETETGNETSKEQEWMLRTKKSIHYRQSVAVLNCQFRASLCSLTLFQAHIRGTSSWRAFAGCETAVGHAFVTVWLNNLSRLWLLLCPVCFVCFYLFVFSFFLILLSLPFLFCPPLFFFFPSFCQ